MERCATCLFWLETEAEGLPPIGLCRRNPPAPILVEIVRGPSDQRVPVVIGFFPQTRPEVACGEWAWRDGAQPVTEGDTRGTMQ